MIVIGLTGGIGTGKSEAAKTLGQLGATVIDADAVGHEVYASGTPGHRALAGAFGPGVVGSDGEIDRAALGELVFADAGAMDRLNALVHPLIREAVAERLRRLETAGTAAAVVEAAILLEAGWDDMVNEVWVVEAPADKVMGRLRPQFGGDEKAIAARVKSQVSQGERRKSADVVIKNDGTLKQLRDRIEQTFNTRIKSARERSNQK
jgi:dephospho-CoA kinase